MMMIAMTMVAAVASNDKDAGSEAIHDPVRGWQAVRNRARRARSMLGREKGDTYMTGQPRVSVTAILGTLGIQDS